MILLRLALGIGAMALAAGWAVVAYLFLSV